MGDMAIDRFKSAAEEPRAAEIFEEGRKAGEDYNRARWYWQAGNKAALAAMGWPIESPVRPKNPYRSEEKV